MPGGPGGGAGGGGCGAPGRGGSLPGEGAGRGGAAGPGTGEVAVAVAEIALEQAAAAQRAKRDAYDQRVAASGGRGVPGTRPAPPEQAAPVRRCRERLAAARKAARARTAAAAEAEAGQGPPGGDSGKGTGKRNKKPPRPVRNITDPDSRRDGRTRNGTVQARSPSSPPR